MAGIFALATPTDPPPSRETAERLAQKMALYPWQSARILSVPESGVHLGAVVQDNPALDAEGYCARQESLICVVDGYFIRSLEECGAEAEIRRGCYARAAIEAYRKFGSSFPERLEGAFAVLLHDARRGRLIAGNGHLANPHLYWHAGPEGVLYCTQLGPMAGCGFFAPEADHEAIGRILTDGSVSGTETLFRNVQALELASTVEHDLVDGTRSSRVYWNFGRGLEPEFDKSFRQHLDELCDTLQAAGRRITSRSGRYVAGLSGGLDSRLVAALAVRHRPDLKSWTFGTPDSPDMIIAAEVSRALDIEHLTWPTRPELVPELAHEYALTVDGCISSDFAYGLERTKGLMKQADIVLNGLAGEVILGDYLLGPNLKLIKTQAQSLKPYQWLSLERVLGRKMTDEQMARFMALKAGRPSGLARYVSRPPRPILERLREQLANLPSEVDRHHYREHLMMTNRVTRWTIMGILSDRHFYSDGSLFYDYEVIDRCMAIPQRYREGNRMYSAVFSTLTPEVADIRNANNDLRAGASPLRAQLGKVQRAVRRKFNPVRVANPATGNNPDGWSRNLYPEHYRTLLADERTRSRPFWDGSAIADLYEKHLSGEVNIGTPLGQLASLEYFFREWVD